MSYHFSIVLIAFFLLLGLTTPSRAQVKSPMTAVQLQALCASKYDIDFGICAGYVAAVADRLTGVKEGTGRVCLSPAVSPQLLVANVRQAWDAQAPQPQDSGFDSVESALRQRFRCP